MINVLCTLKFISVFMTGICNILLLCCRYLGVCIHMYVCEDVYLLCMFVCLCEKDFTYMLVCMYISMYICIVC